MGGYHAHTDDSETVSSLTSFSNSTLTGDDDFVSVPLTDVQRIAVVVVHFLTFFVGAISIGAFLYKYDTLRKRIWCPYLLLMGLVFFQIAGAFEIGNHYYEGNWELAGFPSDLINGNFYFFNFGATYLNALGLRKKGVPIFRRPILCCCGGGGGNDKSTVVAGLLDVLAMIFDLILVVGFFITAPAYAVLGRADAVGILSGFAALGGFATLFRLWRNLGPNCGTLFGGLGWWTMVVCGIVLTSVYMSTGYEWLHALLGSFFVFCLIPMTVGILCATEEQVNDNDNDNDNGDNEVNQDDSNGLVKDDDDVEAACPIDESTDKNLDIDNESNSEENK